MPPPPPSTAPPSLLPTVTPASLSSLAIYNPTLGATDETLPQQLVFHTSALGSSVPLNLKLRQIGLAQGISEFGRGFSGCAHTSIDTQKARFVTLELEPNWWIHAEIALTCIHNPTVTPPTTEWNNREVSPVQVIVAQIRRAHRGFCFQYGTMEECWKKMDRAAFAKRIEKYWMKWAWVRWDPVIGGSPVVDVLSEGAIKMAGAVPGKELEDKEREWLRNWAETEKKRGLVDIVVSRFGEAEQHEQAQDDKRASGSWFWGKAEEKETKKKKEEDGLPPLLLPSDGCVFAGIGNLDTREVANYLQEQYEKGDETYVVTANGIRRRKRKKKLEEQPSRPSISSGDSTPTHRRSTSTIRQHSRTSSNLTRSSESPSESTPLIEIPPAPISEEPEESLSTSVPKPISISSEPATTSTSQLPSSAGLGLGVTVDSLTPEALTNRLKSLTVHNTKVLNLLTFGWGSKIIRSPSPGIPTSPTPSSPTISELPRKSNASFLIGFQGDLSHDDFDEPAGRITSRSVWLPSASSANDVDGQQQRELKEYKIVVYTNKPFITALLYPPNTRHLSSPRFYRTLHAQLEPLLVAPPVPQIQKPPYTILLLNSTTSPSPASAPGSRPTSSATFTSTASTNTPNTANTPSTPLPPRIYTSLPPLEQANMTRQDALHIHQMLLTLRDHNGNMKEKSVRTVKGWWGYWMKLENGEGFYVKPAPPPGQGKGRETDAATGMGDVRRVLEGLAGGV
ncbi:hypothetical protein BZA77DRAFT_321377 [Pyronema omphalodes]|nr:hypothetical protein BZA77DRAFT_321377 [Pyronema omphalodes]